MPTVTKRPGVVVRTPRGTSLIDAWLMHAYALSRRPADFYCGCRKIFQGIRFSFPIDDSLTLAHAGYTSNKIAQLKRHYLHEESIAVASKLWDERIKKKKYGSVGFTCYNHFIKNDPNKKSKRASVMGPCIQAVTLTWMSKNKVSVDAFYRTTELFKKFPADLVFIRDVLLPRFNLKGFEVSLTCHFANVTCHAMYFVIVLPLLDDPIRRLTELKSADKFFYNWIVKWTARYLCPEFHRGIAKFAQAQRVKDHATRTCGKNRAVIRYLRKFHPGYRGEPVECDSEDD